MAIRMDRPEMYEAARAWRDAALLGDDSLFTPGEEIWSTQWLDELHERLVVGADTGRDPFSTKLHRQLKDATPTVYQLMGELLFFHFLAADSVTRVTKRNRIEEVLGWSPEPVSIPATLELALDQGVGNAGSGFNTNRHKLLRFLLEFTLIWKRLDDGAARIVSDPWEMKCFIEARIPGEGDGLQRNALLHLPHGNPPGLRARCVRSLYDPRRRPSGAVLLDVRGPVRRHGTAYRRGLGRR